MAFVSPTCFVQQLVGVVFITHLLRINTPKGWDTCRACHVVPWVTPHDVYNYSTFLLVTPSLSHAIAQQFQKCARECATTFPRVTREMVQISNVTGLSCEDILGTACSHYGATDYTSSRDPTSLTHALRT